MNDLAVAEFQGDFEVANSISNTGPDTSLKINPSHDLQQQDSSTQINFYGKMDEMNKSVTLSPSIGDAKGKMMDVYA